LYVGAGSRISFATGLLYLAAGFLSRKTSEIPAWSADDARQRCRRPRPIDRLVPGMPSIRSSPIPPRWLPGTAPKRPVLDWRERLVCSKCGSREIDMVVTGTERRPA
jgi:hypothetical protein